MDEAIKFLKKCSEIGRIVPSQYLTTLQVTEAKACGRFFVDDDCLGYAIIPWHVSTWMDRQREHLNKPIEPTNDQTTEG